MNHEFAQRVEQLASNADAQAEHLLKLINITLDAWKGEPKFASELNKLRYWQKTLQEWRKRCGRASDPYERYSLVLEFIALARKLGAEKWAK